MRIELLAVAIVMTWGGLCGGAEMASAKRSGPVSIIFDTDMGNDIDDALALGVLHALQSRGECRLLAVTSTKDNEFSAPYIDLVNNFFGRGDIPVGAVRAGKTPAASRYIQEPCQAVDNGKPRYKRTLQSGKDAPEAVALLRKVLAAQPDQSVAFVVVGFSTNIARLLESKPDEHSPLDGLKLVATKCRLLSMMAGAFKMDKPHKEYNIVEDLPAAQKALATWPTPVVMSGFEIGLAIKYPAVSIDRDYRYVRHHPLAEAYRLYMKMPYDRETWDLTAALYAVRPDRGYFGLSEPGTVQVDAQGLTTLKADAAGKHRYLTVTPDQITRVREALVFLASQPPSRFGTTPKK